MQLVFLIVTIIVLGLATYYIIYVRPKLDPSYRAGEYEKQNLFREALIEYKKILEEKPGDFVIHFRLANIYLKLNEIDQAAVHFEEIIRINRYNYEVDKLEVLKSLSRLYHLQGIPDKSFQTYLELLNLSPSDPDALYQVSFMALGQEEFDFAQKYFERLTKINKTDYEVFFGAGMCSYQNQKINEAINHFKTALEIKKDSDAANLAMAFALQRKRDIKQAVVHAGRVVENAQDFEVIFFSKRFLAFLHLQSKKAGDAVRLLEEILTLARSHDAREQVMMTLFDLGYAALRNENTAQAFDYWEELYQMDRGYNNIQKLLTRLRKEMDTDPLKKDDFEPSVMDGIDEWINNSFDPGFIWDICGLKSEEKFDIKNIMVTARIATGRESSAETRASSGAQGERLDKFIALDTENFRIIANRLVTKMGYKVDQILQTYREADGVDFLAVSIATKEKALIWVRRWTKTLVGEITLRNFAQAINDSKSKQGLFITTSELTEAARGNLDKLSKVTLIYPDQLDEFLRGLI